MKDFFTSFEGADIERLSECIKAVHAAGLTLYAHTQAGVNRNSGNVWVWSETWAGCVYCTVGFDVAWMYSCPECGAEHSFTKYEDMVAYADKWAGQCDACADEETEEA